MITDLIKLCLIEINKLNINIDRNKYKVKYSNTYYLNFIFYVLNNINNLFFISKYKYHYKSIYNKFLHWSKNNVFKNAFYNYHFKLNTNLLLIDTTSINNKYGNESIVINPEYKKKKITKLLIISNKFNFIHSVEVFDLKTQNENYNISVHDVKMIKNYYQKLKLIIIRITSIY